MSSGRNAPGKLFNTRNTSVFGNNEKGLQHHMNTPQSAPPCNLTENASCALQPLMAAQYNAAGLVAGIHINQLLHQTASLMATNAQLRKEIEQARVAGAVKTPESLLTGVGLPMPPSMQPAALSAPPNGTKNHPPPPPVPLVPFAVTNNTNCGRLPLTGRRSPLPESYKTVMCQAWLESTTCSFGENCRFAHGEKELRPPSGPPRQNRKYKTKLCDKYTTSGLCPYGNRCLFIHPQIGNNAYIRPDKLAELNKMREAEEGTGKSTGNATTPSMVPRHKILSSLNSAPLPSSEEGPDSGYHDSRSLVGSNQTPQRPRSLLRPHPSWPLEPPNFFDQHKDEDMDATELPHNTITNSVMTPQQSNGHPAQLSGQYAMTTLLQLQQHVDGQSVHGGEKEVGQRMHHECITRPCSPFQSIEYTDPHVIMGSACPTPGGSSGYASGVDGTPASISTSGTCSPFESNHDGTIFAGRSSLPTNGCGRLVALSLSLPKMSGSCSDMRPLADLVVDELCSFDPFSTVIGFDNIAREMANHFHLE